MSNRKPKAFTDHLRERLVDPEFRSQFEEEHQRLTQEASMGRRIARLREQMGLTQQQVAARMGMHRQNISRLESPVYASFTVTTLGRLAAALEKGIRISFVSGDGEETAVWEQGVVDDVSIENHD